MKKKMLIQYKIKYIRIKTLYIFLNYFYMVILTYFTCIFLDFNLKSFI